MLSSVTAASRRILILCRRFLVNPFLLLSIYPIWFMYPVLDWSSKRLMGEKTSDTSGAVWMAQILSQMRLPWSPNLYTNYPLGESFWHLTKFAQFWQWMYMWIITRFASPYFAVNTLFLIGWITTGVVTFYLARKLRLPVSVALVCGLIVQTLPWFREKLTAHTSFMFISIPLLAVYFSLSLLENRTKKIIFLIIALITWTAFFDPYLFYISVTAVIFVVLAQGFASKSTFKFLRQHLVATFALLVGLGFTLYLFIVYVLPASGGDGLREISIVDRGFLDTLSGTVLDFVMPDRHHWFFPQNWATQGGLRWGLRDVSLDQGFAQDVPNYMGLPVVVLFLASFLPRVNRLLIREIRILRALAVFLFALSLRTFTFGSLTIPALSEGFKYIYPGARVFSRFALLAEPIAIIIAVYVVFLLSQNLPTNVIKLIFCFGIFFIMLLDFHPTNNREYLIEHEQFAAFNNEIVQTGGGVLVLSNISHGVIVGPTVNGITENWKSMIVSNAEDSALAAYLSSLGVNYVVTDANAGFSPTNMSLISLKNLNFDPTRFPLIKTLNFHDKRFELRGVQPLPNDKHCADCLPFTLFVDYGFIDKATTRGAVSWVTERRLDLLITPLSTETLYRLRMNVFPPFGGFAESRTLLIEVNGATKSFVINPPFTSIEIDFAKGDLIKIFDQNNCVIPSELEVDNPDGRCLLYGFSKIDVIERSE